MLLTITAVFLTHSQEPQVQWVAGILLKNVLKDNLVEVKEKHPTEIQAVEQALFLVLATAGPVLLGNKKVQEEYYMIISQVIIKEFFSNEQSTLLLQEVIKSYQNAYN